MPGRKYSVGGEYRYGFNGKENSPEINSGSVTFEERNYDSRLGRFISIDPLANKYPWQSPYVFAANNPVTLIDVLGMGPGDPKNHTVVKGETLSQIGEKFGVSVEDLAVLNDIKDINKISIGQNLSVNPEANFSKNPLGKYKNLDKADGVEVNVSNIANVGINFVAGAGNENIIVVGGDALKSVQNWKVVIDKQLELFKEIYSDGKYTPGEAAVKTFKAGNLPSNIKKSYYEFFERIVNGENPSNNILNTPINVIGSFNISMRVNANGTTATVCIYDSKTFKSFSDGNASDKSNKKRPNAGYKFLTNTYQRYLWNIDLPKK